MATCDLQYSNLALGRSEELDDIEEGCERCSKSDKGECGSRAREAVESSRREAESSEADEGRRCPMLVSSSDHEPSWDSSHCLTVSSVQSCCGL